MLSCADTQEGDEAEMPEQAPDRPWNREEGRAKSRLPPPVLKHRLRVRGPLWRKRGQEGEKGRFSECQSKSLDSGCRRTGVSGVLGGVTDVGPSPPCPV